MISLRKKFKVNCKISDDQLQWVGAIAVITGHILNTLGTKYHQDLWNILAFSVATAAFLVWSLRVKNRPQALVNIVTSVTCTIGLVKAFI
jgi:hypothetical protein